MSYEFKNLSDVEQLDQLSDSTTIMGFENGKPVQFHSNKVGGGASSWNDLTDKPFGDLIAVPSDTLTWDGNTDGLVSADGVLYKVSDVVLTMEDLANGCVLFASTGENMEISVDRIGDYSEDGFIVISDGVVIVALEDNVSGEITLPEKGVYFGHMGEMYVSSLTIPGYTGFAKTEVKTIDHVYLPEGYPYKETSEVVVLEEAVVTPEAVPNPPGMYISELSASVLLEIGKEYIVRFNGVEYRTIAFEQITNATIKSIGLTDTGGVTPVPEIFVIQDLYSDGEFSGRQLFTFEEGDCTVGISAIEGVVHPIDEDLLPESVKGEPVTFYVSTDSENVNFEVFREYGAKITSSDYYKSLSDEERIAAIDEIVKRGALFKIYRNGDEAGMVKTSICYTDYNWLVFFAPMDNSLDFVSYNIIEGGR